MSVAVEAPRAAPGRTPVRRGSGGALRALAREEGRRLLRHPVVVTGALADVAVFVAATWYWAPVLHRDDTLTGLAAIPLAGAAFLAANLAALRSRRHGTDELYEATPTSERARTAAHLLSVGWAAALAAVLVAVDLAWLLPFGPVGSPNPLELLAGPIIVALGGTLGVALARWWPHPMSGPVGLVGLVALQIWVQIQLPTASSPYGTGFMPRWLVPWVPIGVSGEPARELVFRPAGWHLVYLVGLVGVAGVVAVLRHGPNRGVLGVGAATLALTVLAASAQLDPPTSAERASLVALIEHPGRYQRCSTDLGVRYCAFPAYEGWIDRWQDAVTPVLERVPVRARPTGLVIRQQLSPEGSDLPVDVLADLFSYAPGEPIDPVPRPTSQWGRGPREGQYQLGLSLVVATWTVGLPRARQDMRLSAQDIDRLVRQYPPEEREAAREVIGYRPGDLVDSCSVLGQARAVVALWLAAQATPATEATLRGVVERDPYGSRVTDGITVYDLSMVQYELDTFPYLVGAISQIVQWTKPEANYAVQLLDRPRDEVERTIRREWDRLTHPSTKSEELVALFGLDRLPPLDEPPTPVPEEAAPAPSGVGGGRVELDPLIETSPVACR